jgi:hypothetical protein
MVAVARQIADDDDGVGQPGLDQPFNVLSVHRHAGIPILLFSRLT